ncbi:MAG: hypothetical protein ACD_61C00024G0002, partial [uncultured bacterium]
MKKIPSFLVACILLCSEVLPVWEFLDLEIPVASAAACTISANTDVTAAYVATCDGITIDTSCTLTFFGDSLDMNGSSTAFTVNEGVTVTWSGTGTFTDATESIVINGTLTHADSGSGVILSVSGNVTVAGGGSVNANARGCLAGPSNQDGYGPDTTTGICAQTTGGYGQSGQNGAGHGGEGGRGNGSNNPGDAYDSSLVPTLIGSGGGGGNGGAGADGGGKVWLDVSGTLTINGTVSADGDDAPDGGSEGGGGGSGGSVYITTTTLAGTGSVSAGGGDGGDGTAGGGDGGGGGGGRIAVYYDVLSGFTLGNITATKGLEGGTSGDATSGNNGTTFILDRTADDLRITSGLDFRSDGDYVRADIVVDSGSYLTCNAMTTLDIGASGNYTDNGSTWACSGTVTTLNLSATGTIATTGIDWDISDTTNINFSAGTWTTSGTNTIDVTKTGVITDWTLSNDLTLNNLTWTGPDTAGTSSANGGMILLDDAISVDLVNTDISSGVSWTNLTGLNIDYSSSINANARGCLAGP